MLKKFIVLVGFSALASCASVPLNYAPEARQISFPELDVETSATVGDTLVAQGVSSDLEGITLSEVNAIGVYEFSPGFYPQIGEDKEYTEASRVFRRLLSVRRSYNEQRKKQVFT